MTPPVPPRTLRRACPCGAFLTVAAAPGDLLADECADLFDANHARCRPGDALLRRLAVEGDIPEPLFPLEITP